IASADCALSPRLCCCFLLLLLLAPLSTLFPYTTLFRSNEANPYIDVPLATGMGEMRNALIVRAAQAVIAIGGGWGTLSEIAMTRSEEHTSELQSRFDLVCRLPLEKKKLSSV